MNQTTYTSSRILLPVKPRFVVITLFSALVLNFLPTMAWPFIPDWVMLVLCFWAIREPEQVGMGWAFVLGLFMDVADTSLMGLHALAYIFVVHAAFIISKRILWFQLPMQALHILPLILVGHALLWLALFISSGDFPQPAVLLSPLISALLWVPLTYLLLLPQHRPDEHDKDHAM